VTLGDTVLTALHKLPHANSLSDSPE
jgi:hypothetical protein